MLRCAHLTWTYVYFNRQIRTTSCADIQRANDLRIMREFKHPPWYSLRSSAIWCGVGSWFSTDVSGQPICPCLKMRPIRRFATSVNKH